MELRRSEVVFPTALFEFMLEKKPEGPLFSSFAVANYQLLRLPEYKVFVDPRDVIFDKVKLEYKYAFSHPDGMKALLTKYSINSAFIEIPKQTKSPNGELIDALRFFFPPQDWAVVAFSDQKCILLRRTEKNSSLIAQNEFKVLKPTLPPQASLDNLPAARLEVDRCLALEPKNAFCNLTLAIIKLSSQDASEYAQGKALLKWLQGYAKTVSDIDAKYVDEAAAAF